MQILFVSGTVWRVYSLWKDNNLYEWYEAEYEESAGNITSKTVIHLLGILRQERAEEEGQQLLPASI